MPHEDRPSAPAGQPKFSVIIPFYNEESNVVSLLEEVRTVCEGLGGAYEVIAVNDGSGDGTAAILAQVGKGWTECRPITFEKNRGQAAALLAGMEAAKGEILITMDGDGQNDPTD